MRAARAALRPDLRRKGPVRRRRLPDRRWQPARAGALGNQDAHRAHRAKAARRRSAFRRQDDHRRTGVLDDRQQRAFRNAAQRRCARAHPRRIEFGFGLRRLEPALRLRARHRHRRFGARAGQPQRSTDYARRTAASRSNAASTCRPASTAAASSRATRKPSSASLLRCSAPTAARWRPTANCCWRATLSRCSAPKSPRPSRRCCSTSRYRPERRAR